MPGQHGCDCTGQLTVRLEACFRVSSVAGALAAAGGHCLLPLGFGLSHGALRPLRALTYAASSCCFFGSIAAGQPAAPFTQAAMLLVMTTRAGAVTGGVRASLLPVESIQSNLFPTPNTERARW
jgi:hypothetical protein